MLLPPVVPGVPPGPQHHPTLPAGRGVTPRAPRHLCRHRNVVQSSNLSHHTHFGASLPLTSTPTVSCTTGASHQNLHVSDRRINVLIVARLPNRLPEGRLTKGVVRWFEKKTSFGWKILPVQNILIVPICQKCTFKKIPFHDFFIIFIVVTHGDFFYHFLCCSNKYCFFLVLFECFLAIWLLMVVNQ